ncbi:hypothetical protein EJP82_02320 [Paenibacillus anaericanus]|uniref:Uncharacterized protein n=1 Tax=Paenibacillus anaericanus TaxID=170367 RepID=A0A3S1CB35_9BACL|nr:hypothetical protein [Paenibacillus anaericanus]RUT47998.1 hypothetical protein EJP82_02320 [Paenibacillus anaericanus]
MGDACTLSCGHCSFKQDVYLGFGFRYIDLVSILEWYEVEEDRQIIKEFINEKEKSFECFDGLYICHECNFLLNKVYLHMKSETRSYTNSYNCPLCRTEMPSVPLINIQSEMIDCPDCKQEKLAVNFYMDWD